MFPTGRFPMGTPGCSPRVRLCKVHVVPIWERVWRKAGLFIPLRKFRFTADENVHLEVSVSESSVGWSQLQGLNSQSSLRPVVSTAPAVSALARPSLFFFGLTDLPRARMASWYLHPSNGHHKRFLSLSGHLLGFCSRELLWVGHGPGFKGPFPFPDAREVFEFIFLKINFVVS